MINKRLGVVLAAFTVLVMGAGAKVFAKKIKTNFPKVRLAKAMRGKAAIKALGRNFNTLARHYGFSGRRLAKMLKNDHSLNVERDGHLFYTEENLPAGFPEDVNDDYFTNDIPLDQAFKLHSSPGAKKTILLDFDGFYMSTNYYWTIGYNGGNPIDAPAWDLDGDRTTFNSTERSRIIAIWKSVAEDFAAFDVDVTTEEPDPMRLVRADYNDDEFGTRVLISPIASYFGNYGGLAYVGIFDYVGDTYQPALVFPEKLANAVKYISEACSHEAGHNLGLSHDGTTTGDAYYAGHADWAPIMGNSYYKAITHWSRGDYANANNTQDDYAVFETNQLFQRADDHGNNIAHASQLLEQNLSDGGFETFGIIDSPEDQDFFSFVVSDIDLDLQVNPINQSPNLNIEASLYDGSGNLIVKSDPSGLSASIQQSLSAGTYYLAIDGIGTGGPNNAYTDYSSLGRYKISGNITSNNSQQAPIANINVIKQTGYLPLTSNFDGSASSDSDGEIVSYFWDFGDGTSSTEITPSKTWLATGVYNVTLRVEDNDGLSNTTGVEIIVLNKKPIVIASADIVSGTVPLTVSFDASSSYDEDGSVESFLWIFGDGSSNVTTAIASHTYTQVGTYEAQVKVTDDEGAFIWETINIEVKSDSLTVLSPSDLTASTNRQVVTLNWLDNSDNETGFVIERALYTGNPKNNPPVFSVIASIAANQNRFSETIDFGTYWYRVKAINSDTERESEYTRMKKVNVRNKKPRARGKADAISGMVPLTVSFDGSESYDEDGSIEAYIWTFGEKGVAGVGSVGSSHTYDKAGTYRARLKVTDDDGDSGWQKIEITVLPDPNDITRPDNLIITSSNTQVTLNWTDSSTNETAFIVERAIHKGKLSKTPLEFVQVAKLEANQTQYIEEVDFGAYWYRVKAINETTGYESNYLRQKRVRVRNLKPTIVASVDKVSGSVPLTVNFDASSSFDADGDIVSFTWKHGFRRSTNKSALSTFTYEKAGTYYARIRIVDNDGSSLSQKFKIEVNEESSSAKKNRE